MGASYESLNRGDSSHDPKINHAIVLKEAIAAPK
jgi:hypothetical protein